MADIVFCLPHAGGGIHQYLSWAATFGADFDWEPVEYAGRFTRDGERHYDSFDEAVEDVTTRIATSAADRRVGLVGHSFGGSLAFEVGRRLRAEPRTDLRAVVVSSAEPPSAREITSSRLFDLDDEAMLDHLCALDPSGAGDEATRQLLADMLPLIRTDYRLHYSYDPDPTASLDVPLHICWGTEDVVGDSSVGRWRRHTSVGATFRRFPGGHFYWKSDPRVFARHVRDVFVDQAPDGAE